MEGKRFIKREECITSGEVMIDEDNFERCDDPTCPACSPTVITTEKIKDALKEIIQENAGANGPMIYSFCLTHGVVIMTKDTLCDDDECASCRELSNAYTEAERSVLGRERGLGFSEGLEDLEEYEEEEEAMISGSLTMQLHYELNIPVIAKFLEIINNIM